MVAAVLPLLADRDWRAALPRLLAAWRAKPSPRLAALVETVSDRVEQNMPAIPGKTLKARVAAASELVAAKDPADLPRLMRLLPDVKIADATALAKQLDVYLPDPRYLRHVVELLRAQPWGSSTSRGLWGALFAHLAKHPDPRAYDQLATIDLAKVDSDYGREQMQERIDKLRAKLATGPRVVADPDGLEPLEAALAQSGAQGGDLLETIRANPNDLAARAIYADWLTERGDPRGELIALQLAPDPTEDQRRRERALLAERGDEWLGPIAPALREGFRTFRNGFLARARVEIPRALELLDAPEWATLEELWLSLEDTERLPVALIEAPALRGLRFVAGVWPHQLADLAHVKRPLTGLGLEMPDDASGRDLVGAIARPALRELAFDRLGPNGLAWLWATPLAAQLTRLRTSSGLGSIPAWIADDRVPATVATVQVSFNHGWHAWTAELARGSDGRLSRVAATLRPSIKSFRTSKITDLLEEVFDELKPDALEEFTLRLDGTSATKADLAKLAEALARQTRLAHSSLPGDVAVPKTAGPVKTVKAARAEAAVAVATDARGQLGAALSALPDPKAVEVLRALDYTDQASWMAARAVLRERTAPLSPPWVDACFAILALPGGNTDGGSKIHEAVVELLGATAPAGALARTTRLLEQSASHVLAQDLSLIPTEELSGLFDWFEARRGDKAPPRADRIYGAVRAVAALRGTVATRAELERRLATKPLRFVAWAYQNAIQDLADR